MSNTKKTTQQWVSQISKQELPAITSTAKLLEKFSNDDVSSLPKLSQSILHDQALSSCLLRVANSALNPHHVQVSTVSRAAVILGIHSVKNICLTSILIESLFKNKNLSPSVYHRLLQLMANSFHAGLLAKMMVPDYNDDTQEEVYLAAMLYRIGETAFWSAGGELAEELIKDQHLPDDDFNQRCFDLLGTRFNDISKGLATSWSLGNLLSKSLDHPEKRTDEMKIIFFADKLSGFISKPPESIDDYHEVLDEIGKLKNISRAQLIRQLKSTRTEAISLLRSYGARALKDLIKPLPTIDDFDRRDISSIEIVSKEKSLLNTIKKLTTLTRSSKDFNAFLQVSLQSLARNIDFERCSFFILANNKTQLKSCFAYDRFAESIDFHYHIDLNTRDDIFAHTLKNSGCECINDYKALKWRNYMTENIVALIDGGVICIAPVEINNSGIGIIVGQRFSKKKVINDDDFSQFCFVVEHLNMCLSMISRG